MGEREDQPKRPADNRVSDVPRLSVCIACFNQARFLDDAVRSIHDQRFEGVEIILVDDGSTDHTPEWANRADLRYVRQDNAGPSSARNLGLGLARADYVAFLDADDVYLPGAFGAALSMLEAHPDFAFVYGGYQTVNADLEILHEIPPEVHAEGFAGLLRRNHIAMHATVFYRRATLVAAGGFDPTLRACEDYDVFLRLARRAPFGAYATIAAAYRRHGANSTRNSVRMLRSALSVMQRFRSDAEQRPEWMQAYREGVRFWKQYYGAQLADDVMAAAVRGDARALRHLAAGLSSDWRFARRMMAWRAWLSHLRQSRAQGGGVAPNTTSGRDA